MALESADYHQICATLRGRAGERVAVLITSADDDAMLAVFRGVLGGGEELSDGAPRFFLDDGQPIGRFDETSFILHADRFEWGRVDPDTVVVHQRDVEIAVATDEPLDRAETT